MGIVFESGKVADKIYKQTICIVLITELSIRLP